jgi:hypothetical protein
MRDFFGAFGSEFFRPLATLILPGALALAPGGAALYARCLVVRCFVNANHGEAIGAMVLLAIFAGLILEEFGSRIEVFVFRMQAAGQETEGLLTWAKFLLYGFRKPEADPAESEWYSYLRLAFQVEPVGHRYLRTLVLRLKFELGCCAACPVAVFGLWFWPTTGWWRVTATLVLVLFCAWLHYEAFTTAGGLRKLRREMLKLIVVISAGAR